MLALQYFYVFTLYNLAAHQLTPFPALQLPRKNRKDAENTEERSKE